MNLLNWIFFPIGIAYFLYMAATIMRPYDRHVLNRKPRPGG